jgi:hypothetical protein
MANLHQPLARSEIKDSRSDCISRDANGRLGIEEEVGDDVEVVKEEKEEEFPFPPNNPSLVILLKESTSFKSRDSDAFLSKDEMSISLLAGTRSALAAAALPEAAPGLLAKAAFTR